MTIIEFVRYTKNSDGKPGRSGHVVIDSMPTFSNTWILYTDGQIAYDRPEFLTEQEKQRLKELIKAK